jgi:hypothetical protein
MLLTIRRRSKVSIPDVIKVIDYLNSKIPYAAPRVSGARCCRWCFQNHGIKSENPVVVFWNCPPAGGLTRGLSQSPTPGHVPQFVYVWG